jgi:lysophospholipase L1-like esterase
MKPLTSTFCLCLASLVLLSPDRAKGDTTAVTTEARTDKNSQIAHEMLLEKARHGGIDLYFEGDSITRRWGATDYPAFLANWRENFFGWNAADFGWGSDGIQNILWRLENGELDGVNPKVIVVLAGTNNVGAAPADDAKIADITRGIKALIDVCRQKAPSATIVLMAIFPRNDNPLANPTISRINQNIAAFADGKSVRFLDINDKLADKNGVLFDGMTVDKLHPTLSGYKVWADGLRPILTEVLGPRATVDRSPPPTGDPSAKAAGTERSGGSR